MNTHRLFVHPYVKKVGSGFTLVEITIAIGVFAFCILAILGLLSVGSTSSRDSKTETVAGLLAERAIANIRNSASRGFLATSVGFVPLETFTYYDHDGTPAEEAEAYFRVTTSLRPADAALLSQLGEVEGNLMAAMAEVTYPYRSGAVDGSLTEKFTLTGLIARPTDAGW
jgi:uncharacterized protein (TIGR02598 family)